MSIQKIYKKGDSVYDSYNNTNNDNDVISVYKDTPKPFEHNPLAWITNSDVYKDIYAKPVEKKEKNIKNTPFFHDARQANKKINKGFENLGIKLQKMGGKQKGGNPDGTSKSGGSFSGEVGEKFGNHVGNMANLANSSIVKPLSNAVGPAVESVQKNPSIQKAAEEAKKQELKQLDSFHAKPAAKPAAAKPAAKPVAAKPAAKPVAAKPVAAKPVAAKPAAKPVAAKPVAAKPAAAKPAAAKPAAAKPAAAKPAMQSGGKKTKKYKKSHKHGKKHKRKTKRNHRKTKGNKHRKRK